MRMMVGNIWAKDKLVSAVLVSAVSHLRIFTLGGGPLRVIMEDSLKDIKVQVKLGLIALLFVLEGFLFVSLLIQFL